MSSLLLRPRAPASRASASASTPDSVSSAASVGIDDGDDYDDDDDVEDVSGDDDIFAIGDDVAVVDGGGVFLHRAGSPDSSSLCRLCVVSSSARLSCVAAL